MMYQKCICILAFGIACINAQAPFKVLHYTETSGFDHNTRVNSLALFQNIGTTHNFTVDNDNDGTFFNSLSNLQQYTVVIFSNTSGDNILDATQKANFEAYINGGGSYLGIHAASDTYRHSTANGINTGSWDWYAEMAGASVQQNPNHVNGTPLYNLYKIGTHPTTDHLPDPWAKNEEYYYWESGYYNAANIAILEVEQTIGPNSLVNSYDSIRPMAWYKNLPGGGRSFYTALGHENTNFTSDSTFINFMRDALLWTAGMLISIELPEEEELLVYPNPASNEINIEYEEEAELFLVNIYGQLCYHTMIHSPSEKLNIQLLPDGIYFLQLRSERSTWIKKICIKH